MSRAFFGVAGNPPNFWKSEFKKDRSNAPQWLKSIGLDALEIQCTRGVRMPDERAKAFKENGEKYGVLLSIHGPYFISIGTSNREKTDNSLNELRKAVELAQRIGSNRVIFHPGSIEDNREEARARSIALLQRFENEFDLGTVKLYPEIAGKVRQLGSLEDILEICSAVESAWPCLDLAHLHARDQGKLRTKDDFAAVIDQMERKLGPKALEFLHIHLYPIEWNTRGEVTHKAFHDKDDRVLQLDLYNPDFKRDDIYLPRYEPFLELIVERMLSPVIICEAKDSQDIGAKEMKKYYEFLNS